MSREGMIAQAEASLGVGETAGNNANVITRWYGLSGEPWCDQAITYWAFKSGNQKAVTGGAKYAYTVAHANWFRSKGEYHSGTSGIQRGDIVFFNWHDGGDTIDHVGIVTGTSGGVVYTIEGNIGNACRRKARTASVIAGYGRPAYAGSNNAPAPSSGPAPSPHGLLQPFPGTDFFHHAPHAPLVERMGQRLVAVGCGRYAQGPGQQWTLADKASYAAWQRKCGLTGSDADGWPGKASWDKLHVPA